MAVLLRDVKQVVAPGAWVGTVAVFGDDAFTVLTGRSGKQRLPILGAARYGQGRIVLGGHEGLFGNQQIPDQAALATNVVTWLAAGKAGARVLLHGHAGWEATLTKAGFKVTRVTTAQLPAALSQGDVLLAAGGQLDNAQPAVIDAIAKWIENGGGYFDAIPIWGWMQVTGRDHAADCGSNRITARAGLMVADGGVDPTGKAAWVTDGVALDATHAQQALARLLPGATVTPEELAQVGTTLTSAAGAAPADDRLLMPKLARLIAGLGDAALPTAKAPLKLTNPVARMACVLQNNALRRASVAELKAHPAAATFPGAVAAEVPRVTRTVAVDTATPAWASLGLYAAPGEAVEVTLPDAALKAGLGLRIGCHTDTLWGLESWQRFPEISYATKLTKTTTRFGNPFGGVVYIDVPGGCKLGRLEVKVAGAVEMPLFVRGVTSLDDWKTRLRGLQAPWAELATKKIILSVPASVVRTLDDPEALLAVWDKGMDAQADLAGIPRDRPRPERMACDQQISAGYMHSGYPIMTWLDVPPTMVDIAKMRDGGAKNCWGFWHELGHNHQQGAWTFDGTVEVTNNLFSLYSCEVVSGEKVVDSSWLNPAKRSETVRKYFADGAPFDRWKSDPALALMMYAQLQQQFGWDAVRKTIASYRTNAGGEQPKSDQDKRDQWMVRFSRTVGRNLGPFFTTWGVPTSDAARKSIEGLPVWLPADIKNGIPFTMEK
ncbi:MAG: hypothetical protein HZB16_19190 [Armatimonadetes bacterium]|nr:hypothetical protein [Armatimonadota bacterium]